MDTNGSPWDRLEIGDDSMETIASEQRSFAQDVWYRFSRRPSALGGAVVVVALVLFAVLGPFVTGHTYFEQNLAFVNIPPRLTAWAIGDSGRYAYMTQNLKLVELSGEGRLLAPIPFAREDLSRKLIIFDYAGTPVSIDYSDRTAGLRLVGPDGSILRSRRLWNRSYLLGTDSLGRDLLTRLMYGARISLTVAFIAAFINLIIGILYGGVSGYLGGNVDNVMMRVVDVISTIPLTLYVILIMVILDSGFLSIIVALSSVYWVSMARVVRGQIMALKEQEFVLAARTIGTSPLAIVARHLIPNCLGPIIVTATMLIPTAIFVESFMSFIGLGVSAPMASWGTMCNDALETMKSTPHQLFAPATAICLTMFSFNFIGDGLRDALDPKMRK
ncbi:MAG: ABC transporter permease [Spirochaetes bacterium]|nr:ABC transporter permease [Spirochaetota bacterium]MBU1081052.1 ABC transporter permease [Spirochaetota bacterium]